jgi:tRNA A-37 threonylcarbamoyl transferase component Bud32
MTVGPVVVASRYRLGETLGVGGMGRVFLARDEILDRDVAIKEIVLPEEIVEADRDAVQQRTLREARAAARVSHPNAAQVYDVIAADGATWIVMEYVKSRSLQDAITADGPLEPTRVAEIGMAVLGAIEAAHRAGVRHRDVKPANVLLGDDGRVVLTDFGIATIEGDGIITSSDLVLGSPQYMSPERVRDGTTLPASDLWSLGATLYTAVEGRPPYKRASVVETLTAVAADEPTPAERAGVLAPVLEGLLRKDPAARIDVQETRRLLEEALTGEPAARPRWPWSARRAGSAPAPANTGENRAAPAAAAPREPTEKPAAPAAAGPPSAPAARATAPVTPRQRVPESETIPGAAPEAQPDRPATPPRRRRSLLVAGVAAAVLAAGGTAWYARHDGGEPSRSAPTAGPTRSAPDSPTPGASAIGTTPASPGAVPPGSVPAGTPAASAPTGTAGTAVARPALPAGWRDYTDPTGFRVYVPKGWTRSKKGSMVYFRDGRGHVLGIDQTKKPEPDPVADWRGKAEYRVGAGDFPGYHEIKIVPVKYWLKAADWEFTFNGSSRQHVNNRGFITSKKQAYGIYWQTTDARWKADRDDLQLVFDSFRPKPA